MTLMEPGYEAYTANISRALSRLTLPADAGSSSKLRWGRGWQHPCLRPQQKPSQHPRLSQSYLTVTRWGFQECRAPYTQP